jgi:SAM-dependent methyltransferase
MFNLNSNDLQKRILGCGDGPASFNAEMSESGHLVISIDPIYDFSATEIAARFDATSATVIEQMRATPNNWVWSYHRSPDDLLSNRRKALACFLADYENGRAQGRYMVAALPELPFPDKHFGLALCSHLLFLYSEHLSEEFHTRSIKELCRVADEVRIFPLLSLAVQTSPHVLKVRASLEHSGWASEIRRVDYELQKGGNEMLRIFNP